MPDPTLQQVQQDLAKAKQFLTDAGYGPGQLSLTYAHPTGQEEQLQPGVLLQDALRQIGVELKLQVMPFTNIAALSASGAANTPDIMTLINTPKGIDPGIGMLQTFFHSKNDGAPYNWGHYRNPAVDKLLDDAQRTLNESQRLDMYRQAQRIVVDEVPALFLAFPNRWAAMSKQIGGYWLSPVTLDRDPYYDMYWVK
jgi:peptide/nickel transport system substrate-binding protein